MEQFVSVRPYKVGSHTISPPVVLAPMADITNGSFRRLVKKIGCPGLLVTELISTTALHHGSKRSMEMFDITPDQHPLAVQLFGSDADFMAEAARMAVGEGADIIDINMGCWVPKVCKTGAGAAMMRDEDTACRVTAAVVRAVKAPVTVKMRAGWDYGHLATAGLAARLEQEGAAAFALHARYAVQGHTGNADWRLIAGIKAATTCPVIGNGDIHTPLDAARMMQETGCDGVMIGRAAIGNPWLIRDTCCYLQTGLLPDSPSLAERIEAAMEHLCDLAGVMGEERAVRHLRGQLPYYIKGAAGAARLRERIVQAWNIEQVCALLNELL